MRNVAVVALVLGSVIAAGCDEEKKPTPAAPSASASAAAVTPSASASAAPKPPTMAEMSVASNKLVLDGWNSHEPKKVAAAYAADAVLKIPGLPDLKGREAIAAEALQNFVAFTDFKLAFARVWQKGNVQVIEWVVNGTNTGDFMGKKATGRPTGVNGVSVVTLTDEGLIKEDHRYFDMTTTTHQLDPKAVAGTFRAVPALPTTMETHLAKDDPASLAKVNEMYAAIDSHKADGVVALFTDDATLDDYSQPAVATGKKGIKDTLNGFFGIFPDLKQTNTMQFVADGWVISEGTLTGTQKGALGPVKATNKPVTLHYLDLWQVREGRVVASRSYSNAYELLVAVGAAPAPGAAPSASAAGSAGPPAPKASAK